MFFLIIACTQLAIVSMKQVKTMQLKCLSLKQIILQAVSLKRIILIANFSVGASLGLLSGANAQNQVPPLNQISPLSAPLQASPANFLDSQIKNFQAGQPPVIVPAITFVDVNAGRFGKLEIDLEDGQFLDTAVDKLHFIARDLDVREGVLKSLAITVNGGHLSDFTFDHLFLATDGDLKFDPGVLINHRLLQFTEPASASVTAIVSQSSLNRFLNSPKTLQKLSVTAGRKAAALASLVGVDPSSLGLNVSQANLSIKKGNKVTVDFQTNLGFGQVGLPINVEIQATLALQDGLLTVIDPHLSTAGQEISPELSNLLLRKIANVSQAIQNSQDIRFTFTDLKVIPNKLIELKGTAQISRLRFGRN